MADDPPNESDKHDKEEQQWRDAAGEVAAALKQEDEPHAGARQAVGLADTLSLQPQVPVVKADADESDRGWYRRDDERQDDPLRTLAQRKDPNAGQLAAIAETGNE